MGWIVAYYVIGAIAALTGYVGMRSNGHDRGLSLLRAVQLFFAWPIMYAYMIVMVVIFHILCGGWL